METATDLVPILQNMGMIDAFIPDVADFSGIDGARDLSIDAARHQAVVQVDEAGTEAAGATVVTFVGLVIPPFTFRADHPFLFLRHHQPSIRLHRREHQRHAGGGSLHQYRHGRLVSRPDLDAEQWLGLFQRTVVIQQHQPLLPRPLAVRSFDRINRIDGIGND